MVLTALCLGGAVALLQFDVGYPWQAQVAGGFHAEGQAEAARYEGNRGNRIINVLNDVWLDIQSVEQSQQVIAEAAGAAGSRKERTMRGTISSTADPNTPTSSLPIWPLPIRRVLAQAFSNNPSMFSASV